MNKPKILKYLDNIRNFEDLSYGSIRTLKSIEDELNKETLINLDDIKTILNREISFNAPIDVSPDEMIELSAIAIKKYCDSKK